MTKSQIDKLSEMLRSGRRDEAALRMLDALYEQRARCPVDLS
jgi:hypothetical protein